MIMIWRLRLVEFDLQIKYKYRKSNEVDEDLSQLQKSVEKSQDDLDEIPSFVRDEI